MRLAQWSAGVWDSYPTDVEQQERELCQTGVWLTGVRCQRKRMSHDLVVAEGDEEHQILF